MPMPSTSEQARALEQTAGARFVDDLRVVFLTGDDQRAWLNGQVTNDVRNTEKGQAVYGLAVTVKGRIMADVWALDLGQRLAITVPADAQESVLASFESQIIMEDVELEPTDLQVLSVQGPRCAEVVQTLPADLAEHTCKAAELDQPGRFVLVKPAQRTRIETLLGPALTAVGGLEIDPGGWELARLRARRPRFGSDFGMATYPQEAGLKDRAVSFNKGCYLGQEVVCTLESRGRLARRLCALAAHDELTSDLPLCAAGAEVGRVTSAALDPEHNTWLALGFVKQAHTAADTVLESNAGSVRVVSPIS